MFDQLQFNKHLIEYQQEEIEKAQNQLQQLKDCLILQNETLNTFLEENRNLKEEISRRCLNNSNNLQNLRDGESICNNASTLTKNHKRKADDIEDHLSESKRIKIEIPNKDGVIEELPNFIVPSKCAEVNIPLTKLEIPCLENKIIYDMKYSDNDLIIGGSDGLLIKYADGIINEFDTEIKGNILYIKNFQNLRRQRYVAVFTKRNILFFLKKRCLLSKNVDISKLYLAEIESVYRNGYSTFICLNNGLTKIFTRESSSFKLDDDKISNLQNVRRHFYKVIEGASFVTLEDSLFYKVKDEDITDLELVSGFTCIEKILKWSETKYICASNDCVWLIDSKLKIYDILTYKNGIKFIESSFSTLAVIDNENTVHVYQTKRKDIDGNYRDHNDFKHKTCERSVEGNITAFAVTAAHITVAVGDKVFNIK